MRRIMPWQMPPGPKFVLTVLAYHANDVHGRCFPTVLVLAKETGMGRSTLIPHLSALKFIGAITSTRVGRHNEYRISQHEPDRSKIQTYVTNEKVQIPPPIGPDSSTNRSRFRTPTRSNKKELEMNKNQNPSDPSSALRGGDESEKQKNPNKPASDPVSLDKQKTMLDGILANPRLIAGITMRGESLLMELKRRTAEGDGDGLLIMRVVTEIPQLKPLSQFRAKDSA